MKRRYVSRRQQRQLPLYGRVARIGQYLSQGRAYAFPHFRRCRLRKRHDQQLRNVDRIVLVEKTADNALYENGRLA